MYRSELETVAWKLGQLISNGQATDDMVDVMAECLAELNENFDAARFAAYVYAVVAAERRGRHIDRPRPRRSK